jgi:uncharacterized protein YdhG (YjbR/CyaY superfamily)
MEMKMKKRNTNAKSTPASDVDDYLAAVPEDVRAALAKLRKTIKAAAPKATEVISYQIPAYKHQGLLVGFASSSGLCTFHIMSVEVTRAHAADLKGYKLGKASIRFAPDKPLPVALVTKLVKASIAENEAGRSYGARQ